MVGLATSVRASTAPGSVPYRCWTIDSIVDGPGELGWVDCEVVTVFFADSLTDDLHIRTIRRRVCRYGQS
jgi:hypothetical protein